jgi:hypothetical protein
LNSENRAEEVQSDRWDDLPRGRNINAVDINLAVIDAHTSTPKNRIKSANILTGFFNAL